MRWAEKKQPKYADSRIRSKFLFFPTLINGEWRWLEYAHVGQVYRDGKYSRYGEGRWINNYWSDQ